MELEFIQKAIKNTLDHPGNTLCETSRDLLDTCVKHLEEKSETRVYVIDTNDERVGDDYVQGYSNDQFMFVSEEQGRVYTLDGFTKAFNLEEINTATDVIRFIEVPVSE